MDTQRLIEELKKDNPELGAVPKKRKSAPKQSPGLMTETWAANLLKRALPVIPRADKWDYCAY